MPIKYIKNILGESLKLHFIIFISHLSSSVYTHSDAIWTVEDYVINTYLEYNPNQSQNHVIFTPYSSLLPFGLQFITLFTILL
jgi:hypothetical protein